MCICFYYNCKYVNFLSIGLPGCTPYPTDVIFVLDSSVSQTKEQFDKQLDFVKSFVMNVEISYEKFQIAVITFSTEANSEIQFYPYFSKEFLLNKIRGIKFRPGATFTNKGLKLAMEMSRDSERRQGMATLTYVFVLTDGMSNKRSETKIEASKLKNSGIKVIAIGKRHVYSPCTIITVKNIRWAKAFTSVNVSICIHSIYRTLSILCELE